MLRIDRTARTFQVLEQRSLPEVGIRERSDLQQMIRATPDPFFRELGERLLLVGEELRPAEFVDDRIDLLAVDETGGTVIIELKRGGHKLHLLQAIAYAGMVAKWDRGRFVTERSRLTGRGQDATEDEFEEFIGGDVTSLNTIPSGFSSSRRVSTMRFSSQRNGSMSSSTWMCAAHGSPYRATARTSF